MHIPAPYLLLPPVAEFLSLYIFSGSGITPGQVQTSSLLFSLRWHHSSRYGFSLAHRTWLAFCKCSLDVHQSLLSLALSGACTWSWLQSWGRCGWDQPVVGDASCWILHVRLSQQLMGRLPDGVQAQEKPHPFNALWESYLSLFYSSDLLSSQNLVL